MRTSARGNETRSKTEYAAPAGAFSISAEDSIAVAGRKLAGGLIHAMWKSARRLREEAGPEPVHELRITMRRLRLVLALFSEWLGPVDDFRRDLTWLGRSLGKVRDLDTMLTHGAARIDTWRREAGVEPAPVRDLRRKRADARRRVLADLACARGSRLLPQLLTLAESGRDAEGSGRRPALKAAPHILYRVSRRLHRRRHTTEWTSEQLHRFRLAFKRLRYACECLTPLAPELRTFSRRWEKYQDCLGGYRDGKIAAAELKRLLAEHAYGERDRRQLRRWRKDERARAAAALRRFEKQWNRFPGRLRRFWTFLKKWVVAQHDLA